MGTPNAACMKMVKTTVKCMIDFSINIFQATKADCTTDRTRLYSILSLKLVKLTIVNTYDSQVISASLVHP